MAINIYTDMVREIDHTKNMLNFSIKLSHIASKAPMLSMAPFSTWREEIDDDDDDNNKYSNKLGAAWIIVQ